MKESDTLCIYNNMVVEANNKLNSLPIKRYTSTTYIS